MKTRLKLDESNSTDVVKVKPRGKRNSSTKKSLEKRAQKLQKHRVNMVEFRLRKKEEANQLRIEHQVLESLMRSCLKALEQAVCQNSGYFGIGVHNTMKQIHELVLERELIRKQNLAMQKELKAHQLFQQAFVERDQPPDKPLLSNKPEDGWWVHFSKDQPPFYYHPFSADEVEATANPFNAGFTANLPEMSLAGTFLGWNVYRELNIQDIFSEKKLVSRVRFTKRVRCSIDTAFEVACVQEKELRPLLFTPPGWSCTQRDKVSAQVLQEINPECRVMVHNIPGCTDIRYIFLARVAQWKLPSGKRKTAFSMMISDSEANKRNRDADILEENVKWITEGWAFLTITEIQDNAIDVVYDHCAGCGNESHAGLLMAQWAQFIVRWEQIVVPPNLLSSCS